MYNNDNRILSEKIKDYLSMAASICTITSVLSGLLLNNESLIYGVDFFKKILTNLNLCILIFSLLVLVVQVIIIIVHNKETGSYPSIREVVCIILLLLSMILCFLTLSSTGIKANENEESEISKIDGKITINDDDDLIYNESKDDIIEKLILESNNTIIPFDILNSLSDNELYYVRNGIYAYSGMYFESNYYNKYPWYSGKIHKNNFQEGMLNQYQQQNISNILEIENSRKTYIQP